MPSTRRAVLAAMVAAGCTGRPSGSPTTTSTAGRNTSSDDSTPDGTASGGTVPRRWRHETPHDALGLVTLAPGAGGPAAYASSAPGKQGDGHALHALDLGDGTEQWRLSVPNPVQTRPLSADSGDGDPRLYFATGRESLHGEGFELHAADPSRGERVWRFDTDERRFVYPLAATEQTVFVGRRDDQLGRSGEAIHALAASDGHERWRVESGDAFESGHAVRRETVVVRTAGGVRALDVASGDERWRIEGDDVGDPAFDNRGERMFLDRDGVVRALGLRNGDELWRREFDVPVSRVTTPREAMSETVFVGDERGRLLALSPLSGETRWTYSVGRETEAFAPSVERTSERLYVGGAGVHALDPVSGERQWTFAPDAAHVGVQTDRTVFASTDRRIWALDPATGDLRWAFDPGTRVVGPGVAGHLAVVGVGGTVSALDGGPSR